MDNFFLDNSDLKFFLKNLNLKEVITLQNNNFLDSLEFDYAPENLDEAYQNYNQILASIGDLAANRFSPRAKIIDKEGSFFDKGIVKKHQLTQKSVDEYIQAGGMGFCINYKYNGINFPTSVFAMVQEIISRADPCIADFSYSQASAICIELFGNEEQKSKYLPLIASGKIDCSACVTEAHGGSDPASTSLKAIYNEAEKCWFLNGIKRFITNGSAKINLVLARSERDTTDASGLSYFICEVGTNVKVRRIDRFIGVHGESQCEIFFDNAPAELLGERATAGIKCLPDQFKHIAMFRSAFTLGIAEAAFREAKKYAEEREILHTKIKNYPLVYSMLFNMRLKLLASRTILYESTKYYDLYKSYEKLLGNNKDSSSIKEIEVKYHSYLKIASALCHMVKVFVCEEANKVAYDAIQVLGGVGLSQEFNTERHYRDARIGSINCGTTQIHTLCAFTPILDRNLNEFYDNISKTPSSGKAKRLFTEVNVLRIKMDETIQMLQVFNNSEYTVFVAMDLVKMETLITISYLLIRDSTKDATRDVFAESFVRMATLEFDTCFRKINGKDLSLIDNHEKLIAF